MIASMDRVAPEKLAIHQPSMFLSWVKFERDTQMKKLPEVELLRHMFSYDADSGILRWKNPRMKKSWIGRPVGNKERCGYLQCQVDGAFYMVHRIVWFMHYGEDPFGMEVDHIDGNRSNNMIENLRLVSREQNTRYRTRMHGCNTSGNRGVSFDSEAGKWKAYIRVDGRQKSLGRFADKEEAILVADKAREIHYKEYCGITK